MKSRHGCAVRLMQLLAAKVDCARTRLPFACTLSVNIGQIGSNLLTQLIVPTAPLLRHQSIRKYFLRKFDFYSIRKSSSEPPITIRFSFGGRRTRGEAACRTRAYCMFDAMSYKVYTSLLRNTIFNSRHTTFARF